MGRQVDKRKYDLAMQYIRSSEKYSLESFVKEHNLLQNAKYQGDNVWISCPYHSDSSPSMSINFGINIYRCFGCGVGGSYVKFVSEYLTHTQGKTSVYNVAESILKSDIVMRNALGINSIYTEVVQTLEPQDLEIRRFTKFREYEIGTFPALANKMIKDGKSLEDRIYMISLMQSGMSAKEVYNSIYGKAQTIEEIQGISRLNINDILNEEEDI